MNPLTLAKELIKNDLYYFQTFSSLIRWEDCFLFHNQSIPLRYDANKAMFISSNKDDLPKLLDRISRYYLKHKLVPRLEINPFSLPPDPENILENNGWECLKDIKYSVMLLDKRDFPGYEKSSKFSIKKVDYESISTLLKIRASSIKEDEPKDGTKLCRTQGKDFRKVWKSSS